MTVEGKKGPVNPLTGIGRSAEETAANVARYESEMQEFRDADLQKARSAIVKEYRVHPGSWPDGIDSPLDRWYRPAEWNDAGNYIGPEPCIRPAVLDEAGIARMDEARAKRIAHAREALGFVEAKLGVKPVVVPPDPVTKSQPTVTKSPPLPEPTEVVFVTQPEAVAEVKIGRPPKETVLSAAERARRAREKRKAQEKGEAK